MKILIVTPATRYENLTTIYNSIFDQPIPEGFQVEWKIIFDIRPLKELPIEVLKLSKDARVTIDYIEDETNVVGKAQLNMAIEAMAADEWMYVLDDDNILHETFFITIALHFEPGLGEVIAFHQKVEGRDFTGLDIREAKPENMKLRSVDQGQVLIKRSIIGDLRYQMLYVADGIFIEELHKNHPEKFFYIQEVLSYYNKLEKPAVHVSLPRVVVYGKTLEDFRSRKYLQYESDMLAFISSEDSKDAIKQIVDMDPDCIVTFDTSAEKFPELYRLPYDLRRRWIDVPSSVEDVDAGERAYMSSMYYILNRSIDKEYNAAFPLVSLFTPIYNTGEKLYKTYRSIARQTYQNWEWVLVNDSTDRGKTLKIAEAIAAIDPRVKVYDFREKSGGIVGEAKYRAACLTRGKYLVEMDHDDELTTFAMELMVESFRQFPDAGFSYSDCTEIDEEGRSMKYGPGFAMGYGSYYIDEYEGKTYEIVNQQRINPKTMRHIVGVPNHFRAWERDTYFKVGAHNRRLSIADDYELIVRTFLGTRMVHVPKVCYLQYMHANETVNNTQNVSRADIQRRVRTISDFYNEAIKDRFVELTGEDWAYNENPRWPGQAESRYGEAETAVNYTMKLPEKYEVKNKKILEEYDYEKQLKEKEPVEK